MLIDSDARVVAATGWLTPLVNSPLLQYYAIRPKDSTGRYEFRTVDSIEWAGTLDVRVLTNMQYRLCILRKYLDQGDAPLLGAIKSIGPGSRIHELETRSFFSINDASWRTVMTVAGSCGRRVVGIPEEACSLMSPYANMHPEDVTATADVHRIFVEQRCPVIVTHRMFNFALNRYDNN